VPFLLHIGMYIHRRTTFHTVEEICGFESLVAAHEDVEVDIGLGEGRHVGVRRDDLALHQQAYRRVQALDITEEGQLHIILRLLPGLQAMSNAPIGHDLVCYAPHAILQRIMEAEAVCGEIICGS